MSGYPSCVRRTEWMTAMCVPGDDDIGLAALFRQICQKRFVQERHVAAHHQYLLCRRVYERCVETPKRTGTGDPINDHSGVPDPMSRSVARDDQYVWGEAPQQ
jgi:hypothetical protein